MKLELQVTIEIDEDVAPNWVRGEPRDIEKNVKGWLKPIASPAAEITVTAKKGR